MTTKRITLDEWIGEALHDPDKSGRCTRIVLVHRGKNDHDEEVHSKGVDPKKDDPAELASLFQKRANAYAQDMTGVQTFGLLAFYEGSKQPQGRHPFVVYGATDFGGGVTEAADAKGAQAQAMRLVESNAKGYHEALQRFIAAQGEFQDRLARTNEDLMRRNESQQAMVLEMMVRFADMQSNRQLEILKFERENAWRENMMRMAPALVNGLTGNEIFPQATADTAIIEKLAETIDLNDPVGSLQKDPALMAVLFQRMTDVLAAKRKREEERQKTMAVAARAPNELAPPPTSNVVPLPEKAGKGGGGK